VADSDVSQNKKYSLSNKLITMSANSARHKNLMQQSLDIMEKLRDEFKETVVIKAARSESKKPDLLKPTAKNCPRCKASRSSFLQVHAPVLLNTVCPHTQFLAIEV